MAEEPVVALAWLVGALVVVAGGVVLFKRCAPGARATIGRSQETPTVLAPFPPFTRPRTRERSPLR